MCVGITIQRCCAVCMYVCMNIPVQRTSRLSCVQELSEHLSANYLIRYVEENMYVCMYVLIPMYVCMEGSIFCFLIWWKAERADLGFLLSAKQLIR